MLYIYTHRAGAARFNEEERRRLEAVIVEVWSKRRRFLDSNGWTGDRVAPSLLPSAVIGNAVEFTVHTCSSLKIHEYSYSTTPVKLSIQAILH